MFKQPAGDPADGFIIYEAGNWREHRRMKYTANRNQLKGDGVREVWGGHAAATVITHPSWKRYTGNSHSLKGAVTRSGNNTHSVQYVFKTRWIWQLIFQLLCKKTLRYFITIIICIRRGKHTHTHTFYFNISNDTYSGFQVPAEAQDIQPPGASLQKRRQRSTLFSHPSQRLIHVTFCHVCAHKSCRSPVQVTGTISQVTWSWPHPKIDQF